MKTSPSNTGFFSLVIPALLFFLASCGGGGGTKDDIQGSDDQYSPKDIQFTFDAIDGSSKEGIVETSPDDTGGDVWQGCTNTYGWECKDYGTKYRCVNGVPETEECGENKACVAGSCEPVICSPGLTKCASVSTYGKCNETGTAWLLDQPCLSDGEIKAYCDFATDKCVCELPVHVLFLLDASGSMQLEEVEPGVTQWDVAMKAIAMILAKYPFLTYGLATFPSKTVDCGLEKCEGGGGCAYTDSVNIDLATGQVDAIKKYLVDRELSKDPKNLKYVLTPLLGIMDYLADVYPESGPLKTHSYPAYIVILSDGQDSCHNPLNPAAAIGPLAAAVQKLLNQYDVKTFAIGFNLADGFNQLDAIAMHGGTGLAEHLPADDLASLTNAFTAIFESMEIRNCDNWDDPPKLPDCTDTDGDGWCAPLDCDDANALKNHGAAEVSGNGSDDDCDGLYDEPLDELLDQDKDGFTPSTGDCNDFDSLVNPTAFEDPDDGIDNDCDGNKDEKGCPCVPQTGATLDAMACAAEISCLAASYKGGNIASPTGDDLNGAWTAVNHFGSSNNDLAPKAGPSYSLIASGPATGTSHSTDIAGGGSSTDIFSSSSAIYDIIEYTVTLQAPLNAKGFSIDYVFFSEEYDDYVGTEFNDKFYILMNAPKTTNGQVKVINFTDCRNPSDYYDLAGTDCPLASGYCCYIAINTALSECCWYAGCPKGKWTTDISGTGFSCAASSFNDDDTYGSSTGWLTTSWTIEPGETFTLTFHVHDTGDGIFDSEVILDNFRWHSMPTTPGTEPAG